MAGQSQRLRLRDMRDIHRLLGECRDLGHDAIAWQMRLFEGLCRLVDAQVGLGGLFDGPDRPMFGLPWIDYGWPSAAQRSHWLRYNAEGRMSRDPTYHRFASIPGKLVTCGRERLADDGEWYRSTEFNEYRRPSELDAWMVSAYRFEAPGSMCLISLCRPIGAPQFTPRELRLVRLFHLELVPLLGTTLSVGPDQAGQLPPRLRQTLDRLLQGDSEKQAARHLGLSPHTVHEYVMALYRRFKVTSRAELLAHCLNPQRPSLPDDTPILHKQPTATTQTE